MTDVAKSSFLPLSMFINYSTRTSSMFDMEMMKICVREKAWFTANNESLLISLDHECSICFSALD